MKSYELTRRALDSMDNALTYRDYFHHSHSSSLVGLHLFVCELRRVHGVGRKVQRDVQRNVRRSAGSHETACEQFLDRVFHSARGDESRSSQSWMRPSNTTQCHLVDEFKDS